jgi:hypothetical protein
VEQSANSSRALPSSSATPAALPSSSYMNGASVPTISRTQSRHSKPTQNREYPFARTNLYSADHRSSHQEDDTIRRSSSSSYSRTYDGGNISSREAEHRPRHREDYPSSSTSSRSKKKQVPSSGHGHHVGDNGDAHGRHKRPGW